MRIPCSPFCILRPATSPSWTCCPTCAYLSGARCCLTILCWGCWDKAPRHISVGHMLLPLLQQRTAVGLPPLLIPFFSECTGHAASWVRKEALECPPRISSGSQWLLVDELGLGGGVRHTTLRLVAGREGTGIWSRGECSVRRRMLQSEPVLHPNQRCGGCAARPSILHTKGHPPCPSRSPPRQPTSRNCGAVQKEKVRRHTHTHTQRDRKTQ